MYNTWTWANSKRWWGTERPGLLQSMGSQRVRHDWATEQQQPPPMEKVTMLSNGKGEYLKYIVKKVQVKLLSCVQLFSTPWTIAHQAPLSIGFSRQEYWYGWPFLSPGDLSHPGIEPTSPEMAGGLFTTEPPGKSPIILIQWWNLAKRRPSLNEVEMQKPPKQMLKTDSKYPKRWTCLKPFII